MKTLFIALGSPTSTAQRCAAALQAADAYWNYFEDVWFIRTNRDAEWWTQRLQGVAEDPRFNFAIFDMKIKRVDGVMPMEFYDWLKENGA